MYAECIISINNTFWFVIFAEAGVASIIPVIQLHYFLVTVTVCTIVTPALLRTSSHLPLHPNDNLLYKTHVAMSTYLVPIPMTTTLILPLANA